MASEVAISVRRMLTQSGLLETSHRNLLFKTIMMPGWLSAKLNGVCATGMAGRTASPSHLPDFLQTTLD